MAVVDDDVIPFARPESAYQNRWPAALLPPKCQRAATSSYVLLNWHEARVANNYPGKTPQSARVLLDRGRRSAPSDRMRQNSRQPSAMPLVRDDA